MIGGLERVRPGLPPRPPRPPWFNVLRDSVQLRDQEEALWRDTQAVYKFNA